MSAADITLLPALLLTYLLHSTIAVIAALLLDSAARLRPAQRAALWRAAAVGPLLTTPVAVALRTLGIHGSTRGVRPASAWAIVALLSALIVGLWGMKRVVALIVRERRLRGMLRSVRERVNVLQELCDGLSQRAGVARSPCIWSIAASTGPFACGANDVYVPASATDSLDPDELRAVLAHEVAHIARRDPLWARALGLIAAACPLQPLSALALKRSIACAELASDDVARTMAPPAALARSIVRVAEWGVQHAPAASLSGSGAMLRERVQRLLLPCPPHPIRRSHNLIFATMVSGAFCLLALRGPAFTSHRQVIAIRESDTAQRVVISARASTLPRRLAITPPQ